MHTPVYDISIETGEMGFEKAGPLFERYAVSIVGTLDRRWVECYTKLTKEKPNLSRFRLEAGAGTITFMCRATDGPAEVQGVLERLREMIRLVNETATAAARAEAEAAKPAAARPTARAEESGVARLASMTSGLFARLSRASTSSVPANAARPAGSAAGRSK
jgi:hypothetical protein